MDTHNQINTKSTRSIGLQGEQLAEHYLSQNGLTLIERNFSCRHGEIDLIMAHNDCLVFIEVRQRKNALFGSPAETVNLSKQRKLRRTAELYCLKKSVSSNTNQRFDVVGIISDSKENSIEWIPNAF